MDYNNLIGHIKRVFIYKRRFSHIGYRSLIIKPMQIDSPDAISIGDRVYINHYAWLKGGIEGKTTLWIGNNVQIGHFAHIISRHSLKIEEDVLLADRVFITDCTHNYEDIDRPILEQGVRYLDPVVIGEGSWIGENVCICGASIGKHCVIGANSVVNSDIPDYCVAAGSPARIIKKYDFDSKQWVKV